VNKKIYLGINIDHVATVRQARRGVSPDVLAAAFAAEKGGADGITVHLREDRRHIQDADVFLLRKKIATRLNLEMALHPEIIDIALRLHPDQITIVPEKRKELTTEGGLDVIRTARRLKKIIPAFHAKGICVSLFIDPVADDITCAKEVGADAIELHTGQYAEFFHTKRKKGQLLKLMRAANKALACGLVLNAGHGLDYENTKEICALPDVHELNIGHSIISRALFVGLEKAVREMKNYISR